MAYCTTDHVAAEFKGHPGFSSSTKPTEDDVLRFIAEADAEINGTLSQKYAVPITGSTALFIIRTISIGIVKKRVADISDIKSGTDKDQKAGEDSATVARKMLKNILDGVLVLPDATASVSGGGVRSYTYDNEIEPSFNAEIDQW